MGHSHGHGSLHGLFHTVTGPFSRLYHATVTPTYVWLGNKLGGRAKAGQNSHNSRILRLLGNAISLAVIATAIALTGWSHFWSGGALLPSWALYGVGIGISINLCGWLMGAASNHLKIEQYYDMEMELHAENDELRQQKTKLTGRPRKIAVNGARTLHDLNGIMGTATGFVTGIPAMLALVSIGAYSLNPILASTLFLVSRASAIVSVVCVWGTNQLRLWSYKKAIDKEMGAYYELKRNAAPLTHEVIDRMIDDVLKELNVSPHETYTKWVRFRCYKTLESAGIGADTKNKLVGALGKFKEPEGRTFSREKLMRIQGENAHEISVLDSMLQLEAKLFDALCSVNEKNEIDEYVNERVTCENPLSLPLLAYHLKKKSHDNTSVSMVSRMKNSNCLTRDGNVSDMNTADESFRAETAHGSVFLPYYGTRKVAETICHEHTAGLRLL